MRAAVCPELGPPSVLTLVEQPDPSPGPGQVLVRVEAAGVNFVDALFIAGQYQIKPTPPFVPGSEIAGTVTAVGDGVDTPAVGQRVLAGVGLGGFATHCLVAAAGATVVPDGLDAARAATFTQSYCTAHFALTERTSLAEGESVLVLGAGGGVGLATVDLATALGARVIAVASSEEKRRAARSMGAVATIDPVAEPLKERARELSGTGGVDLVVDPVGGALAEPALRALGDGGRYVVIGFAAGAIPSLPANQILLRNRTVVGVDWGAWSLRNAEAQGRRLAALLAMVDAGRLHPVAPTTYPLDDVARAVTDVVERRAVGKVAVLP